MRIVLLRSCLGRLGGRGGGRGGWDGDVCLWDVGCEMERGGGGLLEGRGELD